MLLYIHGFGSSGKGAKVSLLRERVQEHIVAPSLSPVPDLAIDTLEQIIALALRCHKDITLAGSSLGGYYATYLSEKYNLKAVLINPSIKPYNTLAEHIGLNPGYFDLSDYEFTQKHIESLKAYDIDKPRVENYLLLLQKGDEVLDYTEALEKFEGASILLEEGGSHGFEGFESKIDTVLDFAQMHHADG